MDPRKFALYGGLIMVVAAVVALFAPGSTDNLRPLYTETSYGYFLGLFPMNIFNKVALILIGLSGVSASQAKFNALPRSIWWSRACVLVFGALAILGMIPATNTLGGYWPLFGGEIVVHAAFALAGVYFGYGLTSKVRDSGPAIRDFTSPISGTR